MVKIRIGSAKELRPFDSQDSAFAWVSKNCQHCIVSVLRYDGDSLESMERYYFQHGSFIREQIKE